MRLFLRQSFYALNSKSPGRRRDKPQRPGQFPIMDAKIENGTLVVRIPVQAPSPSKTGKTLIVASSGGNVVTAATVNGKPVTIGLNAYIKAA